MSFLDPRCPDVRTWQVEAGRARCPDCDDVVPTGSIPAHVDWHNRLHVSFLGGGELVGHVVELFDDGVGELSRFVHELQVARLR
ncbi:MAG: hypothetical protein OEZ14_11310 [Acidimicrobiia bacterium]|nr:hypothetical protein [Acidimicrobiia bacterium]